MTEIALPERPEPEDCESLSFDAYSGFQMLKYGRECVDAGYDAAQQELAACQAREKVLISAIAKIKAHVTGEASPNWSSGEATYRSRGYLADVCEIANHPTDDTALRERLKAERERCASVCLDIVDGQQYAEAIRALGDEE